MPLDGTYGVDYSSHPADLTLTPIYGTDLLSQQVVRRVTTPPGGLWWAQNTIDVGAWVNDDLITSDLRQREQQINALFSPDPRMEVAASLRYDAGTLYVDLEVVPVDGVEFTVSINTATGSHSVAVAEG